MTKATKTKTVKKRVTGTIPKKEYVKAVEYYQKKLQRVENETENKWGEVSDSLILKAGEARHIMASTVYLKEMLENDFNLDDEVLQAINQRLKGMHERSKQLRLDLLTLAVEVQK